MSIVNEQDLPGIGRRYEVQAGKGQRVVLVVHHSGRRDLYVLRRHADEPVCAVELSDDQARRVGAILGGAYFKPAVVEEIQAAIGEFVVDWVTLAEGAPAIGRSIGELAVRRRTGMTVIAIVRGRRAITSPDPAEPLRAGDRLVVVGPAGNLAGLLDVVAG